MRKLCGKSIFWLKFTCYFIILAFVVEISGIYFSKSEGYSIAAIAAAEKQTVIIDAGHGGEDCGAIGINGVYEKDLNLEVALLLGGMLSERGYAIIYTRTQDRLLYTEEEKAVVFLGFVKPFYKRGAVWRGILFYLGAHFRSFFGRIVVYSEVAEAPRAVRRIRIFKILNIMLEKAGIIVYIKEQGILAPKLVSVFGKLVYGQVFFAERKFIVSGGAFFLFACGNENFFGMFHNITLKNGAPRAIFSYIFIFYIPQELP